ncbi:MAG: sigma-70 family RNA polymerase sigma factor [Phycisphaerales bacterium]|nr:MAG: sigma-70 family RNA polymerase sigma factor [Phycisphaerales bacterium]
MSATRVEQATRILGEMRRGDGSAARRLLVLVYDELRALAGDMFRAQPLDHTLQPTALVHEAYIRLVNQKDAEWTDRAHFLAVAAKAMRNLLIDHARKRKAGKHGGGRERVALDAVVDSAAERSVDVLALDEALEELGRLHERQARVVELRFFGGLTVPATAEVLEISPASVDNDWRMARAWLTRRLAEGHDS